VAEAFAQVEHDAFTLLQLRALAGAGGRLRGIEADGLGVYAGLTPTHISYVQPRADTRGHLRVLEEARLAVDLTARLALTLALNLRHDRRPPAPSTWPCATASPCGFESLFGKSVGWCPNVT
jgi:hypothetical protein